MANRPEGAMDLTITPKELAAMKVLADRGGSLPGAILTTLCFDSSTQCTKTMNHLFKIGLVEKGRHTCYSKALSSNLFYVLDRDALGLIEGGTLWTEWLTQTWAIRFNLAFQEMRYHCESQGWQWVYGHKALLVEMQKRKIFWGAIKPHWPMAGIVKEEQLQVLWLFWQGLATPEIEGWEQVTRELRQNNLLLGVTLSAQVSADLRKRFTIKGIRCALSSLEELDLKAIEKKKTKLYS